MRVLLSLVVLQNVYCAPTTTRDVNKPPATSQPLPIASNLPPLDKSVDLDGDGMLSLSEVQYAAFVHHGLSGSVVQGLFNEVDRNKDGSLDANEFDNIRPLVLAKAENAALRYMQSVDTDKNKMLSLEEAQSYILKEHGIGFRDVERVWRLVVPSTSTELDAVQFSKLRRRIRGMTIRLARQIMKAADTNADGHITIDEAQSIAFEQEGIGAGDVAQMFASVDDNNDGELNAPEFADFERIIRSRAVETSRRALKVVDSDGSNTLTMDEARRIAFEHYGFRENELAPFFDQADENEDGHLDAVEFAGFRSVIRNKAVRNAIIVLKEIDLDGDGLVSLTEAGEKTRQEDDMDTQETALLFNIADQNKSGKLDKVELADFIRLVRLSAIRFATDHFKEFDANHDGLVTVDELAELIENKYRVPFDITDIFFEKVDVDSSGDLIPAEIVDFRHEIRKYVAQHPVAVPIVEQEQNDDRISLNNDEEIPSVRSSSTTSVSSTTTTPTTTIAPTTITDAITTTTTATTTTLPPTTNTRRHRIRTTATTSSSSTSTTSMSTSTVGTTQTKTSITSKAPNQHTQSTLFPTLLPSTLRKVTFRKHSTITPQRSNVEELSTNSGRFEEKPPVKSNNDNEWIIEKFENPESFTRKSITSSTPAEDIEYELVEVEIDEDGNEIVSEPITVTEQSNSDSTGRHGDEIDSLINIDNKPEELQRKSLAEKTKDIHIDELQARRKLVQQQKRALNLPDNVEVEYVDGDQQTQSTNDRVVNTDDNIDTEDYSDEKRA